VLSPPNAQLALVFCLVLSVFVLDLLLPLGFVVWLFYLIPIWLASRFRETRSWLVPVAALLSSASVVVGFLHAPVGMPLSVSLFNRVLGIIVLWGVAVLLLRSASRHWALTEQTKSLRHQAKLLDAATVMIRNLDGRILTWSHGHENLYGYQKHEALGALSHRLLKTEFSQPLSQIRSHLLAEGQWRGELFHTRRDGTRVLVASHWTLHRDDKNQPVAVLEVDNDLTDLKKAEEAHRESEDRFRIMADTVPDIIFTNQASGLSDFNNQRFYDYTGLTPGAASGLGWAAAVHPDDLERTRSRWRESMRTGMPYEIEFRLRAKDGSYRWFVGRARPIRDDQGQIMKWFGTCTDIHDLKQAGEEVHRLFQEAEAREKELREKQSQLVQAAKLASLGELASGIAHELNNPLNNISLFLGNALDRIQAGRLEPREFIASLERALQQTERAATIIRHLRTFARTAPTEHEPVCLNEVVLSALSLVQEQLRLRDIKVELNLSPDEPAVMGSRIQLEQVFLNLVANARDALASSEHKLIRISSIVQGEMVEVRVQDSGTGIPAEIQPHIFDPFFTTKPVGEGTGLGLSISYGIIEDHHGRVAVESADLGGSTFVIQLPVESLRASRQELAS
jgi:PAS domain S-box-containing protein